MRGGYRDAQGAAAEGIQVEMIVGCSGGALYAALIALGHPEERRHEYAVVDARGYGKTQFACALANLFAQGVWL